MEQPQPKVKREFLIDFQGHTAVLYAGLLDVAHDEGLRRITTTLIQIPSDDNGQVAICAAEVETSRGIFTGIGDASPANVNRMILPAIIRMAETRAKARALRDAVNVGTVAFEELSEDVDAGQGQTAARAPSIADLPHVTTPGPAPAIPARPIAPGPGAVTDPQKKAIFAIAKGKGMDDAKVKSIAQARYKIASMSDLSRVQASDFIDFLKLQKLYTPPISEEPLF